MSASRDTPGIVSDIEQRFAASPPDDDRGRLHQDIRDMIKETAYALYMIVPAGREWSLVLTNLEQAMMWANMGLARHYDPDNPSPRTGDGR